MATERTPLVPKHNAPAEMHKRDFWLLMGMYTPIQCIQREIDVIVHSRSLDVSSLFDRRGFA